MFPPAGSRELLLWRTGESCECFSPILQAITALACRERSSAVCVLQPTFSVDEGGQLPGHKVSVSLWVCCSRLEGFL